MEIGLPTSVRHIVHVTFDRLNGFLGLPIEFELEVPRRVPSASASVFGVSSESMQCSYDSRGNSIPTILLLIQERLYDQGGLQTEGIFRVNPDNTQVEILRDQLNKGIVSYDIDVHCLAAVIKAWFRELPKGVLDSLSPEQVMQCHTKDQCLALIKTLPSTEAALMDWAINLMTDVVQKESINKMNARNIAVVFAPNMTHMSDPLTALMHAVQVMNLLKTLILKNIEDREALLRFIEWNEPFGGDKDQYIKGTGAQTASFGNANTNGSMLMKEAGTVAYKETHNKYINGEFESISKAFKATEIVEDDESSERTNLETNSTFSSTRGSRDEGDHVVDDKCFIIGNTYGGSGVEGNALIENHCGKPPYQPSHKPLAEWLHYGPFHPIEDLCGGEPVYDDKSSWEDEVCISYDAGFDSVQHHPPIKSKCGRASYQPSSKPLADWLHQAPSALIESQFAENETVLIKAENPRKKAPLSGNNTLTNCQGRGVPRARAQSRRTRYLSSNKASVD